MKGNYQAAALCCRSKQSKDKDFGVNYLKPGPFFFAEDMQM